MSKTKQPSNGKGSLKDIQVLINEHPQLVDGLLKSHITEIKSSEIEWKSPLDPNYIEYRDDDFITQLEITLKKPLNSFWPKRGPQWDALGKADNGVVLLVEAKANIPEIVSPGTGASIESKKLILKSLNKTKSYLQINNNIDWSGTFYQYTNRIAHLYFLRVVNKIPAYLINIYFMNDKEVNGPGSKKEWLAAIDVMKRYLGVGHHKLSKYMIDLFIDVEDFR
jgi:hypothetical protein